MKAIPLKGIVDNSIFLESRSRQRAILLSLLSKVVAAMSKVHLCTMGLVLATKALQSHFGQSVVGGLTGGVIESFSREANCNNNGNSGEAVIDESIITTLQYLALCSVRSLAGA